MRRAFETIGRISLLDRHKYSPDKRLSVSIDADGNLDVSEKVTKKFSDTFTLELSVHINTYSSLSEFLRYWNCKKRFVLVEKIENKNSVTHFGFNSFKTI